MTTSEQNYYPPKFATGQFHCPHCGVFAHQKWSHIEACGDRYTVKDTYGRPTSKSNIFNLDKIVWYFPREWTISICEHCGGPTIWARDQIVYPRKNTISSPNNDLSEDIKNDYFEAANILNDSPRAAAAILRLALQKLCKELGEKGENINDDIGSLVKKGLNSLVQKSLDALRITGNNGVHPGEINLKEEPERVIKLFDLLNFIADRMITEPKKIGSFYDDLPEAAKEAVVKRDSKK